MTPKTPVSHHTLQRTPTAQLAVILVGYNSSKYLDDCLTSLLASTYSSFQVIFIDNNSTDESVEHIRKNFPGVLVMEEKENFGFAGGNNRAIEAAKELGYSYVFLLNVDTVIDANCLEILMEQATEDTILQPLILLYKTAKTSLVNTAGNSLHFLGYSYCGGYLDEESKYITPHAPITLASGAAVLIPMRIISNIGAFDEMYFMYHEDVDLSWRAKLAGYSTYLIPEAKVWHKYHFSRNDKKLYYAERNRLLFMFKNYSAPLLIVLAPFQILNELVICSYSLASGWLPVKLRSYRDFLRLMPQVRKERKKIQNSRKVSDRQLRSLFSTQIDFGEVKIPLLSVYNFLTYSYWSAVKWLV